MMPRMGRAREGMSGAIAALVCVAAAALALPSIAAAAEEAFVRVDQAGYPAPGPKRAYVMSSFSETGAPFTIETEGGAIVATGTIGASTGSWSKAFPDVYGVDFDGVTTPGRYSLSVGGASP